MNNLGDGEGIAIAYTEILKVLESHKDVLPRDFVVDIAGQLRNRLTLLSIEKNWGIGLPLDSNPSWIDLPGYTSLGICGNDHNRTIAWEDNEKQPDNERLYVLSFPTGAYIFGQTYPRRTFSAFFEELASLGCKYRDTANKSLYFDKSNAAKVHNIFNSVFDRYKFLVAEENNASRIAELEIELLKLKGNT